MKEKYTTIYIIGGLVLLIAVLCAASPSFAYAVFQQLQCALYTCVKVVP